MHPNINGLQYLVVHQLVLTLHHYFFGIHIMINYHHLKIGLNTNLVDGMHQISNNIKEQQMYVVLELI